MTRAEMQFRFRCYRTPKLYADAGYQGQKFQVGLARVCRQVNVEIVKRSETRRFGVLPKR